MRSILHCKASHGGLLLALFTTLLAAQQFDVILLEGTGKVQRSQKRDWENLSLGSAINDNDIVETFFQSRMILRIGNGNAVVLGSNTKALFNVVSKTLDNKPVLDVSITLFSGGILATAVSDVALNIYTSNAVAETQNGTISAIVEAKTGETGFQTLDGEVNTRNIAQQVGRTLRKGQTTLVLPNRAPTAPLFLTYRHVAILKHFFGEEYIQQRLREAGITPTEDVQADDSRGLSENLLQERSKIDPLKEGFEGNPFSLNRIYGEILEDREENKREYVAPKVTDPFSDAQTVLGYRMAFALARGAVFPSFDVLGLFNLSSFDIGLRLSIEKNHEVLGFHQFTSLPGALDFIHNLNTGISIGQPGDTIAISLGSIEDLTLGSGVVVKNFSNHNSYSLHEPLGFITGVKVQDISGTVFVGDMSDLSYGGLYVGYEYGLYTLGLGTYYDLHRYRPPGSSSRFIDFVEDIDTSQTIRPDLTVQVDASVLIVYEHFLQIDLVFGHAQWLGYGLGNFASSIPGLRIRWNGFQFGGALYTGNGLQMHEPFSGLYGSNRNRVVTTPDADEGTLLVPSTMLSDRRKSMGISLSFDWNPIRRTSLSIDYHQDFSAEETARDIIDSTESSLDFGFDITFAVSDSVFPFVHSGSVRLANVHGGLFPLRGNYLASWGFHASVDLISTPVLFETALTAGLKFYYLDMNDQFQTLYLNNNIDNGDTVFEFFLGFLRGF